MVNVAGHEDPSIKDRVKNSVKIHPRKTTKDKMQKDRMLKIINKIKIKNATNTNGHNTKVTTF